MLNCLSDEVRVCVTVDAVIAEYAAGGDIKLLDWWIYSQAGFIYAECRNVMETRCEKAEAVNRQKKLASSCAPGMNMRQ